MVNAWRAHKWDFKTRVQSLNFPQTHLKANSRHVNSRVYIWRKNVNQTQDDTKIEKDAYWVKVDGMVWLPGTVRGDEQLGGQYDRRE